MVQLLDFKFFGSSKVEISSNDPALVLCVYFVLTAVCGYYIWTSGAVVGYLFLQNIGIMLMFNGIIYSYASYQIHRYSNASSIGGFCLFVIILFYWIGIWGFSIVLGGVIFLGILLSYLYWKEHYPHLETYTDLIKAIYNRQADAAHIL